MMVLTHRNYHVPLLELLDTTLRTAATTRQDRHDTINDHRGTTQDQAARNLLERIHRLRGAIKQYQATIEEHEADRIEEEHACF